MTFSAEPERFMDLALAAAEAAGREGEVPVGAIVVRDGQVIATAANRRERDNDPTAHAEILALRAASQALGAWRLINCDLYVTLEPCVMCAGALTQSRIRQVFFGATDPKGGALTSLYQVAADERLNHRYTATGGLRAEACSDLLRAFFRQRRRE